VNFKTIDDMATKDRYCISYMDSNNNWGEVTAKTISEARALYDMVGKEATFKVLYDIVSGEQIEQT
jgi:hypothetical protein